MADLKLIIQTIMKCQKANHCVDVVLNNGENCSGYIQKFTGKELVVDDKKLHVIDIDSIKEHEEIDLTAYFMTRVLITTVTGKEIDAVLMESNEEAVSYISDEGQESIAISEIAMLTCDDQEIIINPLQVQETVPQNETMVVDDEQNNDAEVVGEEERVGETKDEPESIVEEEKPHVINAFERAVIDGEKDKVREFAENPEKLFALDYSEKEAERIKKMYDSVAWGMEPFKVATRIYNMQLNKDGVARTYFEKALETTKKNTADYKKVLNSLIQFVIEDGPEEYIAFWKQHASYLKDNNAFCNKFIEVQLQLHGVQTNEFEKLLIMGDKQGAIQYIQDKTMLELLEYSNEDIERIEKCFKNVNWEPGWYKTATRLFGMQLNRNCLAEIFYEAALVIANKKTEEYTKILNALASIKMNDDAQGYILLFKTYREKLKLNPNFCAGYANALLSVQNWAQLEKDMPMLCEQLANNPVYLEKLQTEVSYYKSVPPFVLSENPVLFERYQNDDVLYEQEKGLIEKLPDRNALKTLLEIYYFQKEEKAYFELVDYALFFMKEDKTAMTKFYTMLHETEELSRVVYFLPKIPILWCDADLVKKYMSNTLPGETSDTYLGNLLENHLNSVDSYRNLNPFETAVVNRDYDEIRRFVNNVYILEEFGYTDDEIEDISSIDIETQLSDDIYTMRRILAFQGNRNHVAERYFFEAYYENKIDMCNRLFPLLLAEKRGEFILGVFNFDYKLKNDMTVLRRFYYLALCMVEKDDDVFFSHMESEWMNYPENEILERMILIAKNRKDEFLLKQLELQQSKPRENEFETAIIEIDNETIRKYVKNANLLVELGYTPEEIQKINKIFALGGSTPGTKPGQIANRVYLYQKNKNNLAERLYLNALDEDSPEDVINDCKALFQIYTAQRNYKMVCKIYEEYLYKEMADKFNRTYAATYCIALYELERYEEFLTYIRNNKHSWDGFNLAANLLYVSEIVGTNEFDDFIWENLSISTYRPDIIAKYITNIRAKNQEAIYTEKFADLFNLFFANFLENDLFAFVDGIANMPVDKFMNPKASILAAFVDRENCETYITEWLDYLNDKCDANRKIDVLMQLNTVFSSRVPFLLPYALDLYMAINEGEVSESKLAALEDYIYQNVQNTEYMDKWCELQEKNLSTGKGSLSSLYNYLNIVKTNDLPNKFWEVYLQHRKYHFDDLQANKIFDIVCLFYQSTNEKMSDDIQTQVVEELIALTGEFALDYVSCKKLISICIDCGKNFEAGIYQAVLKKLIQSSLDDVDASVENISESEIDYLGFLKDQLSKTVHVDFAQKCSGWSKYVVISEEEDLIIERLRNTIDTTELWVTDEVNILAKAIVCEPSNVVYWKLFRNWISINSDTDEVVIGAILFHLSSQGSKEMESALNYAVSNDLKTIALELTLKMLELHMPDFNISAQKNLRVMIEKGWFKEELFRDKAKEIIEKIRVNTSLANASDYEWNSVCAAVDLTIATSQYAVLIEEFGSYLSRDCAKQCCVIIADMLLNNQITYIESVFECLNNSLANVPYKLLISDFYKIAKERELTLAEKKTLECIQLDYGNALGVNHLLNFYCDMCIRGNDALGGEVINILMKYTPYDPVLYEVAACFLKNATDLETKTKYYNYYFEYLESNKSENPIEYAVGQMVCGENYLREKGKNIKSFKKFIQETYPKYAETEKAYKEFCDTVIVNLRTTEDEPLAFILLNAIFTGNWVEVLEYKPGDKTVDSIIEKQIKNDRLNIADDYYRSIIKSVALYVLRHSDNMWDVIDNYDRIGILWNNMGNVGCGYEFFVESLQSVSEECIPELQSIWSLDIEILTVYKKFFGSCILQQAHSSSYAGLFNVFVNARSGDIFSNIETQELLKKMNKNDAIEICQNYEQLYLRAAGPMALYSTGKTVNKDSDYENNIFSNYLKKNIGTEYYSISSRYERFKKKYDLICKINSINSFEEANDSRFDLNEKRQVFSLRALYFYYSVLANKIDDSEFAGHRQAEFINAVTIALCDDTYMSELNSFISNFSAEERNALGILILAEQEKLDVAARTTIDKILGRWRGYLCARLVAAYGKNGRENELCQNCLSIAKGSNIENSYWIKNYKRAKSIFRLTPELYFEEVVVNEDAENKAADSKKPSDYIVNNPQNDVFEEIVVSQDVIEDIQEMMVDTPKFIKEFMDTTFEEKNLCELQKQWKAVQNSVENGNDTQESLKKCAIKIGITLAKKRNRSVDEKLMAQIFALVGRYSVQDKYLIGALHDILQNYVCSFADLDLLAKSVYEYRNEIGHLCYEQSIDAKSQTAQDMEAARILIEILTNIANDLNSAMGDESIKERLRGYQDELHSKKMKRISKFRVAANALGKMIQEKINSINYVPYLVISHLGTVGSDNSQNYDWDETWMDGASHGFVRGMVTNRGGAPAKNVKLKVMINSELRETYLAEKIVPGRKIPFAVKYTKEDVMEGVVDWSANVTYKDESNGNTLSSNGYGEIRVSFSSDEWSVSYVGLEKFNTQFAAEGEEFCGRTNELLKLNNLYNISNDVSKYPSLLVTGLRRAGKSSVIKYFKELLRERSDLAPVFIDAQGINGDITNAFFSLVFNELYRLYRKEMEGFLEFKKRWTEISKEENWISQLPTYFMELSELLGNRKVVFILDEMENVFYAKHFANEQSEEQFFGMIRTIILNYQEYVSFIFCGSDKLLTSCLEQKRESQMFQVLQRIYVGRMGINDIRDMFDKYNAEYDVKFGDDAIDEIMYYTNGLVWYTKVIAYNILDKIIDSERIIRDEVQVSDVDYIVEKLISGDLGSELIDLLDNNFGAKRKAIIRAMARATKYPNDSVTLEMISAELPKLNYIDSETGEVLGTISEDDISKNLSVLEKMDFIEKDSKKERAYRFSTELYRLLMLSDRRIDKFVVVNGGEIHV